MRITVSSPDGLGDFVLRMPFFEALRDAGHDLQIFMRPPASDLAAEVLSDVRIETIGEDPYARLVRFRRNPFVAEFKKMAAFSPHLLVIALFQHSFFDEIFLGRIPKRLKVAGFRSADAFWSTEANTPPQEMAKRFNISVEAKTGMPELDKNRLLASAILGSPAPSTPVKFLRRRKQSTTPDRFFYSTSSAKASIGSCARVAGPALRSRIGAKRIGLRRLARLRRKQRLPSFFSETRRKHPRLDEFKTRCQMTCGISISRPTHPPSSLSLESSRSQPVLWDATPASCTLRQCLSVRFSQSSANRTGAVSFPRRTAQSLSRGKYLARAALVTAICPSHSACDV